ncbi:ABC transporter permease [Opitutus terrae]|uniref:Permease n=1 Tax=Opitutus terrae (strain DSM 11246 / JCM 15787 / PB90-1) TaxID=452637 RepID=B1ZXX9_OPITP|nr:ABC transporter permease [Opitutus terrae]ACB75181.1 permease [Opitutus terrae PB90-1]
MKFVFRSLLKSPGFTTIALLTLALGIGVNTAMFGLVNTLLFKAAPYPDAERLVRIFRTSPQSQTWPHSAAELVDLRAQAGSLERFTYFRWHTFSFAEPGQPAERIAGLAVAADFFKTLGVQPALGRSFSAEELTPGKDQVIVLSHGLWQRRFGGDPTIVGRTLRIDGQDVTVIGVMPAGVEYPMLWGRIDAWRPLALTTEQLQNRGNHYLNALGRLRTTTSLRQAQAEFDTIAARWAKDFPDVSSGAGLRLVVLHESTMDQVGRSLSLTVMGLAGFVLLIACANLANLQLARTASRAREYAIRAALGASRRRLIGELLLESVVLSLAGGALGFVLAQWVNDFLGRQIRIGDELGLAISLDLPVFVFALLVSLAAGLLFGVLPAWTASRADVNATLKQQGRGSTGDRSQHRLRHGLIVAEVALALSLLAAAGFFVRGVQRFSGLDMGWNRAGVLTATLNLPDSNYGKDDQKRAFYPQALERLAALPGVEHAALSSSLPIWGYNSSRDVVPEGRPLPPPSAVPLAYYVAVTADFFRVLEVPLVQGHDFSTNVRADNPRVAIVNETLARQFWPGENPIGKRIGSSDPDNKEWWEVIGVVRDVGFAGSLSAPDTRLQVYVPLVQEPWNYLSIALKFSDSAAATATSTAMANSLRQAIAGIDPDLPAYNIRTIEQAIERIARNILLANQLLVGFALLGLLLAAIGLYGVISNLVVQRTPEFGIRIALGAQARDVLWLVLGKGAQLAALGTALGLLGSFVLLRLFAAVIPALPGQDYLLLAGTVVLLLAVALFACWIPARRATRVNPLEALRAE